MREKERMIGKGGKHNTSMQIRNKYKQRQKEITGTDRQIVKQN